MLVKSSIRDTTSKPYSKRKATKKKGYEEEDLTIFVEWILSMRSQAAHTAGAYCWRSLSMLVFFKGYKLSMLLFFLRRRNTLLVFVCFLCPMLFVALILAGFSQARDTRDKSCVSLFLCPLKNEKDFNYCFFVALKRTKKI